MIVSTTPCSFSWLRATRWNLVGRGRSRRSLHDPRVQHQTSVCRRGRPSRRSRAPSSNRVRASSVTDPDCRWMCCRGGVSYGDADNRCANTPEPIGTSGDGRQHTDRPSNARRNRYFGSLRRQSSSRFGSGRQQRAGVSRSLSQTVSPHRSGYHRCNRRWCLHSSGILTMFTIWIRTKRRGRRKIERGSRARQKRRK